MAQTEGRAGTAKKPGDHVAELRELVVGYAKQKTVDPLKVLGKFLLRGTIGAVLVGLGCVLLLLGLLRLLQTFDVFVDPADPDGGPWTWVPYTLTIAAGVVMCLLAAWGAMRGARRRRENGA